MFDNSMGGSVHGVILDRRFPVRR